MYAWVLVFFSDHLLVHGGAEDGVAAYATFAVIAVGGMGCWIGGLWVIDGGGRGQRR